MKEKEAFKYLEELEGRGIKLGLERMQKLVETLNIPEKTIFVKVAGTNGKGSTSTFIAKILENAGYKTGLYLSPHIRDFEERIQVNGCNIKRKELTKRILELKQRNEKQELGLTYFEFITVIALEYFLEKGCNAIVLETGMGGKLDAINALKGDVNVITNISLEHEQYLGHRIEEIAMEKAGIIDKNAIVITGEEKEEVLKIFKEKCKEKNVQLFVLGKEFSYKITEKQLQKTVFNFNDEKNHLHDLEINFGGEMFVKNAALAIESALQLQVKEEAIRKGLQDAKIIGRFQIIKKEPLVIVDCAHNPAGITELVRTVKSLIGKQVILVFGCASDKKYNEMVKEISKIAKKIYCTQAKYRGLNAEILDLEFKKNGLTEEQISVEKDSRKALEKALKEAVKEDVILVCGSCFLVGEIIKTFIQNSHCKRKRKESFLISSTFYSLT